MELLDAVDRGERLAGIVGARQQQLAQLDDAATAKPAQIDDAGEGIQGLSGADVGGGLLATDVLLACLQGQHETAPTIDVVCFAGDAAGHPAQVLLTSGEDAEGGPAKVKTVAERLALADGHVDSAFAGSLEHAERDRVDLGDDDRRAGRLRSGAERARVLDGSVEVGLREDCSACLGIDRLRPGVDVGETVAQGHLHDLHAVAVGVRAQGLDRVGVQARAYDEATAAVMELGEVSGRGDGGGSLIDRGV